MKKIKKIPLFLCFLFLLSIIPTQNVKAEEMNTTNKHIISVQENDNMKVVEYIVSEPSDSTRATQKTIYSYFDVYLDNVYSYTLKQTITYTYAIPSSNGDIAQINSASAKITNTNSSSAYYPDTSSLNTTITVKSGNPAKVLSTIYSRAKSNNTAHGKLNALTRCYGSGASAS